VASGEQAGLLGWRSIISIAKMASLIVEGQLFATFPDYAMCIKSRQFRHDSNYYAWTVWSLKMKGITGFRTSATNHLTTASQQPWWITHIASLLWEPHISKNYRRWQGAPTVHVLLSFRIMRSLRRQRRLRHLWAKFITTCMQTATMRSWMHECIHIFKTLFYVVRHLNPLLPVFPLSFI